MDKNRRGYVNYARNGRHRVRVKDYATRVTVSAKVNAARVRVKVHATRVTVSAKVNAARVRVKVNATRVTVSAKVNAARFREAKEHAARTKENAVDR